MKNYILRLATKFALIVLLISKSFAISMPDEGMWLPIWIEKLNYADMKNLGLKLSAEEIFSMNNSSIKDAIVGIGSQSMGIMGFGCTGVVVSRSGLVLTNHHCAYDAIQEFSSLENDYLTYGFWALNHKQELAIADMTMSFLVRMEDVTEKVLSEVADNMTETERSAKINKVIRKIEQESSEKGKYNANVRAMFEGSEYYLLVYETFRDIRLVGAPPSSIGKFGGDTDNWMWPRHTGDFTFLRIYIAPDGTPADYNEENIPLVPKHFLPVSIKGLKRGDFAMIFGFPGTSERFLTSYGVEYALMHNNPTVVEIRDKKLNILDKHMKVNPKTQIQYAAKHAQSANYWKFFIGQNKALRLHNVKERRKNLEDEFVAWSNKDNNRKEKYDGILQDIEQGYKELSNISSLLTYIQEAVFQGPEFIYFGVGLMQLHGTLSQQNDAVGKDRSKFDQNIADISEALKQDIRNHFKDYNADVDKELFAELMKMFYNNIPKEQQPKVFANINNKKYKGDFNAWANDIFAHSILVNEERMLGFLNNPSFKTIDRDLGWKISTDMLGAIMSISGKANKIQNKINHASRLFIEGLREMHPDKKFYPDANSTMRMTYGKILDYYPADAVHYDFVTYMKGIMEKEDPDDDEFIVSEKLKELYYNTDFGPYGDGDAMPVCFLTDNDITGGNSGSPVINANGHLIGVAFDGNWESLSGDIQYEPSVQRTISVDMRYVLFIVDKFAEAHSLLEEMKIIR